MKATGIGHGRGEPRQHEGVLISMQVKQEAHADTGPGQVAASDSEEELSEGEELRRAARAYAKSTNAPPQEVIVLDDSSDDERPGAAKRQKLQSSIARPTQSSFRPLLVSTFVAILSPSKATSF